MSSSTSDVLIVGGGIVGLGTALALAPTLRDRLTLIEAEPSIATHQTGHNSGVIHSGLYYAPGSLKATQCARGREALYRFCAEHGVAHERCGKVVVATDELERERLDALRLRGQANGLRTMALLSRAELREIEPHAEGVAALRVEETGIVNYGAVSAAYAQVAASHGASIRTRTRLVSAREQDGHLVAETTEGTLRARVLVNCAGLYSDRVARACGVEPDVRIVPFRGEYYDLAPSSRHLVRHLIYPVPDPRFPFLGVHFTRRIEGDVEAGPNAVLALRREGYHFWQVSLRDVGEWAAYGGFWRMARGYWRTGVGEWTRSLSKRQFVRALQKLMPDIRAADLAPGGAGVRAQAVDRAGRLVDDFRIVETRRAVHVLNAPSPAATASIAIGQTIAEMALRHLGP
jgi:L-2-hydroxyglutarate oxidase